MPWKNDAERKEKQHLYYIKNKKRIRERIKVWRDLPEQKENITRYSKEQRLRRKKLVKEIKDNLFCVLCGESRNECLDFHHRDPKEKEGKISHLLWKASIKKLLEEIEKCDVLCANCHRVHHAKESDDAESSKL